MFKYFSFLLSIFFLLLSSLSIAQNTIEKAHIAFGNLEYHKALELYFQVLKNKKEQDKVYYPIAECYRKLGEYTQAESYYMLASKIENPNPESFFYLGMCQFSSKNKSAARNNFQKYIELVPGDQRGKKWLLSCQDSTEKILNNAGTLSVIRNVEELNSRFDDFAAIRFGQGVVFCSERDTSKGFVKISNPYTNRPFTDVYYADAFLNNEKTREHTYGEVILFHPELKSTLHDGPVQFAPNDTIIYFSRNVTEKGKPKKDKNGIIQTEILSMKYAKKSVGTNTYYKITPDKDPKYNPRKLEISGQEYSVLHPAINQRGDKLYFVSDMPGGFGKMDLYVSYLEGGIWSEPINLGSEINTEGDELFPWVDTDGILYFTSDGHTGLGGLDIYYTKSVKGKWLPIENIGAPINSSSDDFSYFVDSSRVFGYFSSNREGGKGLTDIYSFTKQSVEALVIVFDKNTGKGIENVNITSDCFSRNVFSTDFEGKTTLALPLERSCNYKLSSPLFSDSTIAISSKGYKIGNKLIFQIPIRLAPKVIRVKGKLMDDNQSMPMANTLVSLLSNCETGIQEGRTDAEGSFDFIVKANCQYLVKADVDGFFVSSTAFNTVGIQQDSTLSVQVFLSPLFDEQPSQLTDIKADQKNPYTQIIKKNGLNQLYTLEKIYFDNKSDKLDIKKSVDLKHLLDLLRSNLKYTITIRNHTDSKGDATFNKSLSNKRARAIVDYLIKNGIDGSRLTYEGLGESELLNSCQDGVECSEEEHRRNRRTEFKISLL
jgi:outer membrane protein OmpA-like peptidoglycan-associated protein/tetratricopeptide (TPR) repeat protein